MFTSVPQNSYSTIELHQTKALKHSFVTLKGFCFKAILNAPLCLGFIIFLSGTSFAQATLTDDHSTGYGPKSDQLGLDNRGSVASVFFKFDFSGVPAQSNVSKAILKLWVNYNNPGNSNQYGTFQIDVRYK